MYNFNNGRAILENAIVLAETFIKVFNVQLTCVFACVSEIFGNCWDCDVDII